MANYPEPNSGGGDNTQPAYPEPLGGPVNTGLDSTTHNVKYPQPNSANLPGTDAPAGVVPGADAYKPSLSGNAPRNPVSTGNPGVKPGGMPPNYPK